MGNYSQALEYHSKALEIDTGLNNKIGTANSNYNISLTLYNQDKKKQALEHLFIAKNLLHEFEKNQGYEHPLLKNIEDRISFINKQ